ncbi:MAG: glycosyltransferase family 2 protein [Planctomycetes bacterium]|nr:glycosyltransferase family 2 protein [Planctomycetota bacterium]
MPLPRVTAVVVNWNGGDMLAECLASLFAQTWTELEILVVDNGSKDDSIAKVQARWGDRLVLIRNAKNEGFARANNQAFAAATGEWVFLLNNDAVAAPDAIERLMAFVQDRPDVGTLACRINRFEEPNVFDSTGLLLYPDGVCRPRGWQEKDLGQYDRAEMVLAPHGAACAYRKATIDDVGGFDEPYFCYLEDFDFGMRAQLLGWKCWYVPDSRIRHHKSVTAGNYSKFKAYHVERNRIWNAIKLLPRMILVMSPLFTLNRYLMQGYAAATHTGLSAEFMKEYSKLQLAWILLRAYTAALWRLPRMLRERHRLSKRRKISTREWYDLISRYKLDAIELALKF